MITRNIQQNRNQYQEEITINNTFVPDKYCLKFIHDQILTNHRVKANIADGK